MLCLLYGKNMKEKKVDVKSWKWGICERSWNELIFLALLSPSQPLPLIPLLPNTLYYSSSLSFYPFSLSPLLTVPDTFHPSLPFSSTIIPSPHTSHFHYLSLYLLFHYPQLVSLPHLFPPCPSLSYFPFSFSSLYLLFHNLHLSALPHLSLLLHLSITYLSLPNVPFSALRTASLPPLSLSLLSLFLLFPLPLTP